MKTPREKYEERDRIMIALEQRIEAIKSGEMNEKDARRFVNAVGKYLRDGQEVEHKKG